MLARRAQCLLAHGRQLARIAPIVGIECLNQAVRFSLAMAPYNESGPKRTPAKLALSSVIA
jgi:hypothetical protein